MRIKLISEFLRATAIALLAIVTMAPVPIRAVNALTLDSAFSANGELKAKSIQTNIDGSLDASLSSEDILNPENTSAPRGTITENEANIETPVDVSVLVVTRDDISIGNSSNSVTSAALVQSDAALRTYAAQMMKADSHISKIRFDSNEVSLWYEQAANLIGVIPITVRARADVDAQGDVNLRYPWYKFLTDAESAELKSELSARTRAVLAAETNSSVQNAFSPQVKARLATELHSVMDQYYQAAIAEN